MPRFSRRLAVILLTVAGMTFVLPTAAEAKDSCTAVIVDDTTGRVLGDQKEVKAATQRLIDLGVDVRVRVFDTAPGGDLSEYQADQIAKCSSWRGPGGVLKDNTVTYLVSLDRQSYIYYGSSWNASMDDNAARIRADYMNVNFRNGRYSQGIAAAQKETYKVLDAQLHPRPVPRSEPRSEPVPYPYPYDPADETVPAADDNSSSAAFVVAMKYIGAVLALGAIIAGIFGIHRYRRRQAELLKQSEQLAITANDGAVASLEQIRSSETLKITVDTILTDLNDKDTEAVKATWSKAEAAVSAAFSRNDQITDDSAAFDPRVPHTREEYQEIADAHDDVRQKAEVAATELAKVESLCTSLQKEIDAAPVTLERLKTLLDETKEYDADLTRQGFRTGTSAAFETADGHLITADEQVASHDYGQAIGRLEDLEALCGRIRSQLDELVQTHSQLVARHQKLSDDLAAATESVDTGKQQLETLQDKYHSACTGDVSNAFDGTDTELDLAGKDLSAAADAFSMESQEWEEAAMLLTSAELHIQRSLEPCSIITSRTSELKQLSAGAASMLDGLRNAARRTDTSIDARRGSQDGYRKALKGILSDINKLSSVLDDSKPDYVSFKASVATLHDSITEVNNGSAAEHQHILDEEEAERRRLAAIAEAEAEAARAAQRAAAAATAAALASAQAAQQQTYSTPTPDPTPYSPPADPGGGVGGSW